MTLDEAEELSAAAQLVIEKSKSVRRKKLHWMLRKEEAADAKKDYESSQEELLSLSLKLEPTPMPLFDSKPVEQPVEVEAAPLAGSSADDVSCSDPEAEAEAWSRDTINETFSAPGDSTSTEEATPDDDDDEADPGLCDEASAMLSSGDQDDRWRSIGLGDLPISDKLKWCANANHLTTAGMILDHFDDREASGTVGILGMDLEQYYADIATLRGLKGGEIVEETPDGGTTKKERKPRSATKPKMTDEFPPDDTRESFVIRGNKGALKGLVEAPGLKAATAYAKEVFGLGLKIEVDDNGQAARSPGYSVAEVDRDGKLVSVIKAKPATATAKTKSRSRKSTEARP